MFAKLMIANRGEIACRVIRTAKRLGIPTLAVYSEADAAAPHVRLADESVCIGPPPVSQSYLAIERLVEVASAHGVTAVHPGYGLLSENEAFASALSAKGITFVGPSPEALDVFGDKIKARDVARRAGVSPPPGTDGPIAVDDAEALAREAARIGFPLLVKAAGGGGGIGMQVVQKEKQLAKAVASCSDRGRSAFGDPRVYLERYVTTPKHIEVQVLCDAHGNAVAVGDRECSMQRRHQKVIEEAPSPAPFFAGDGGAARRKALHEAALRIVTSVGYRGAGTVEFVASSEGELFFLEVNARLQVEHCVSEMCSGLDLVEEQLRIAAGLALSDAARSHELRGHSIEARIYAEDPAKHFMPQPGTLTRLTWPLERSWLRVEAGYEEGMEVTPYYDPMLAKLVVYGATRAEACARLDEVLAETDIAITGAGGPANTNVAFCRALVASTPFVDATYDTATAEALAKESR
ncbi:MAG: ATP-grasp domain-containing protein [Deltaproteobacteria bacterium]|nr:ATP-grasp domain-containing protein [Deltaproteobacteria bacterium]